MSFLLQLGFLAVASLVNGFALKLLWNWFMVPILELPILSLTQAIGIGIVVGSLTHQYIPMNKEQKIEVMFSMMLLPIASILFGYVVHLFM